MQVMGLASQWLPSGQQTVPCRATCAYLRLSARPVSVPLLCPGAKVRHFLKTFSTKLKFLNFSLKIFAFLLKFFIANFQFFISNFQFFY